MKEEVYIMGFGHNAPVLIDLAEACGYKVSGIYHHEASAAGQSMHGYPVVGCYDDLLSRSSLKGMQFVLSMGNNAIRHQLGCALRALGGKTPNLVNPSAYVSKFVKMGEGVVVQANSTVQPDVILGNDVVVSMNCAVSHNCVLDDACYIAVGSVVGGGVHVKRLAFVGMGSTIISNKVSVVGEGAFIGAGSLVTRSLPDNAKVVGRPAKDIPASEA